MVTSVPKRFFAETALKVSVLKVRESHYSCGLMLSTL